MEGYGNGFPNFPGDHVSTTELVKYYHKYMYTRDEIRAFLILRHDRAISKTGLRRLLRQLGLQRNNIESPQYLLLEGIRKLHEQGFVDAGYRVIWRMLNVTMDLRATQSTVRRLLKVMDPEGVLLRRGHRLRRRMYKNGGPNSVVHIDGYDKLKPFGFSIHGAIDGFSRKILWLNVLRTNKNPYIVSRLYFDWIIKEGRVPKIIRSDAGTENVIVQEIQTVLRCEHADIRSGGVCYIMGRSTGNQRIESFWSFLKRIFTVKWRNTFRDLEDIGLLSTGISDDVENLRMWFTSVIQKELDFIKNYWNSHRIKAQREVECTTGEAPDVMYYQSPLFGARDHSLPLPCGVDELINDSFQLSELEPVRGCSEHFFSRILLLSGLEEHNIMSPTNFKDAMKMYIVTRDLLIASSQ